MPRIALFTGKAASTRGLPKSSAPSGAATLFKPDDPRYRQAFANVIDLQSESFHKHDHLRVKPQILAPINILNGKFYSATLDKVTRMNLEGDPNPLNLGFLAAMVAGDISNTSGNLILRSKDPNAKPLIRLPLSDEKHYEVSILNEPTNNHEPDADHTHDHSGDHVTHNDQSRTNHFPEYYNALVLRDGAMKYEVEIEEATGSIPSDLGLIMFSEPFDPPCTGVWCSGIPELP